MSARFAVGGKSKSLYLNIVLYPFEGREDWVSLGED